MLKLKKMQEGKEIMIKINKITSNSVIDFAAEEFKKYLRMMMPRCGQIEIKYDPDANDGFRLGLMQDFGLSVDAVKKPELDDIFYVDTQKDGGIIAGSNPRSVLLSVYQFFKANGCRWLFPGIDGEYIPMKDIEATKFTVVPDHRVRAQCNEGSESQACVIDAIDFTAKIGMNTFMLEFDIPFTYYNKYYVHTNNPSREKEPVTKEQVLQWKRATEAELAKRGLIEFDMGHGWTAEALGISSVKGWERNFDNPVPEETRQYLAMIDGKRDLCRGVAVNTNICMSNPDARKLVVDYIVKYAKQSTDIGVLKVSLADWQRNHCECDECRKMRPSDYYMIMLNELDKALEKENLNTRIGITIYSDTTWEPEHISFDNPDRFEMSLAPISRDYLASPSVYPVPEKPTEYIRNVTPRLDSLDEYVWRAHNWAKITKCTPFVYEYHFYKEQFYCPSPLDLTKRIHDDIIAYNKNDFQGMMEDCSQRNFFPNALGFTVYTNTLIDLNCDYDAVIDDYMTHAYGDAKDIVMQYFKDLQVYFPHEHVEARHSKPVDIDKYHNEAIIPKLEKAIELSDKFVEDILPYKDMPYRVQSVAIRLLRYYAEYIKGMAKAFILKAQKKDNEAKEFYDKFYAEFGKKEIEIEAYYDQHIAKIAFDPIFKAGLQQLDM